MRDTSENGNLRAQVKVLKETCARKGAKVDKLQRKLDRATRDCNKAWRARLTAEKWCKSLEKERDAAVFRVDRAASRAHTLEELVLAKDRTIKILRGIVVAFVLLFLCLMSIVAFVPKVGASERPCCPVLSYYDEDGICTTLAQRGRIK